MFAWHSTIVEPPRKMERSVMVDPSSVANSGADPSATAGQRIIEKAYRGMIDAGAGLQRDEKNRVVDPTPLLRALAVEGVRLGPEGKGTLLALCDRVPIRPPTLAEFQRCCLTEGTSITPPAPRPLPGDGRGRGRGIGHLCASATTTQPSTQPGRGGRGRGGGAAAAAGPGRLQQSARGAALGASGRGR